MLFKVMKECMTYRKANQFSLYGHKTKRALSSHPLCKSIIGMKVISIITTDKHRTTVLLLADRANGRAYGTMLCPSVICL